MISVVALQCRQMAKLCILIQGLHDALRPFSHLKWAEYYLPSNQWRYPRRLLHNDLVTPVAAPNTTSTVNSP
jgi:hypothetical protein